MQIGWEIYELQETCHVARTLSIALAVPVSIIYFILDLRASYFLYL